MLKVLRSIRKISLLQSPKFTYNEANTYIPIRPLKEGDNVIFQTNSPKRNLPIIARILAYTPCICFALEGFTAQWTPLIIGGTIISFFYALRLTFYASFMRSHEVSKISINKSITKFELNVPNTSFTRIWEKAIWESNNVTEPLALLLKQYQEGKLDMKPFDMKFLKYMETKQKDRDRFIDKNVYKYRRSLTLELNKTQIASFQRRSMKELTEIIENTKKQSLGISQTVSMLENYSTDKQKQDYLLIKTHKIGKEPLLFYANLKKNQIDIFDQYINAFTEGKTIVNIV